MNQARLRRRRVTRSILLAIIVATLPCYCLGAIMLGLARPNRTSPTTLTAQAIPSQVTVTSQFPGMTYTPFQGVTPLPSGPPPTWTPSQSGPLLTPGQFIPTSTPLILPPTATLTFTFAPIPTSTPLPTSTPPVIVITLTPTPTSTPTPTFTQPPTNTDTPTLTPTLTETPTETPPQPPTVEVPTVDPFATPTQEGLPAGGP